MKPSPLLLASVLLAKVAVAPAQGPCGPTLNLRFSATRAQTLPGTCCFYLTGGAADAALPLLPRTAAVVEVAGATTQRVAGTGRGLTTITLLAGPRYALPLHRVSIAGQALFGAVHGSDANFTTNTSNAATATGFSMALGGFVEVRATRAIALRAAQIDFLQTNLPNGADNRQRNVRLGAGITFRVPLPAAR